MPETVLVVRHLSGSALLLLGFLLLMINHLTVIAGDPWLIPEFLKLQ
ncbi:MAG: hypothetical protein ABW076_10900 [Candidatus Thiodiazotropha sp.]